MAGRVEERRRVKGKVELETSALKLGEQPAVSRSSGSHYGCSLLGSQLNAGKSLQMLMATMKVHRPIAQLIKRQLSSFARV